MLETRADDTANWGKFLPLVRLRSKVVETRGTVMKRVGHVLSVVAFATVITSCGPSAVEEPRGATAPPADYQTGRGASQTRPSDPLSRNDTASSTVANPRERQAVFLQRIRSSDPQFQTIDRALFNERNELGVVLNRRVEMDVIPQLMRSLLTQMAREFPGQDLTVLAYAPTDPPRRLGVARLDARTGQMTFKADQQQ